MATWWVFFPDDGETLDDATEYQMPDGWADAVDVARDACENDWNGRDGWERGDSDFAIIVVAPDGTEARFMGRHEPTVDHIVYEAAE